jgi:hypothetical protein
MQLEQELREAIATLKKLTPAALGGRTIISLGSGCDLFMKYVSRAFLEYTVSGEGQPCLALPCPALSYPVLSCPVLSCPIM